MRVRTLVLAAVVGLSVLLGNSNQANAGLFGGGGRGGLFGGGGGLCGGGGCYSYSCYSYCYTPCYSYCYYPCYSYCYYPCYGYGGYGYGGMAQGQGQGQGAGTTYTVYEIDPATKSVKQQPIGQYPTREAAVSALGTKSGFIAP